jgi:chlorobactene glucosyltransferase
MPVLLMGGLWAGLVAYLLFRTLQQFRAYKNATLVKATGRSGEVSPVSIIVPARNEIDNIAACLSGLTQQSCLSAGSPIIVVDDDSQDGTAAAVAQWAAGNSRIGLVAAGSLPEGWIGKPHACWRGALMAEGEWLCFIDADLRAAPELVASAIAAAAGQGIDMLSLQPLQELGSFWERVVMTAGLLMLACAKPFRPASEDAANGQFLLFRRDAYFRVGGHAAVRAEICEDKALAGRVVAEGLVFRVLAAEDLARVRMYRGLSSLWEGIGKNATELLGSIPLTLIAAAAGLVFGWATLLLPAGLAALALADPSAPAAIGCLLALSGSAVTFGIQWGTARHFRLPWVFGLTFALGYTFAAALACHSVLARLRGRVTWKGRTYRLAKSSPEAS